jgi:hypothetical protein
LRCSCAVGLPPLKASPSYHVANVRFFAEAFSCRRFRGGKRLPQTEKLPKPLFSLCYLFVFWAHFLKFSATYVDFHVGVAGIAP